MGQAHPTKISRAPFVKIALAFSVTTLAGPSAKASDDLGAEATAVYARYCRECHSGRSSKGPRFDPSDRDSLLSKPEVGPPLVVPGDPPGSLLWQKLGVDGEMPPKKKPQPTAEEKDLIRRWIVEGAPNPSTPSEAPTPGRKPLLERDAMTSMIRFLEGLPEEDRRHQRFFTLTVVNNREVLARASRKPPALNLYRAALSKAINSLSLERDIVIPRAVDDEKTVYAVDLRELGWDKEQTWRKILAAYPFDLLPLDEATLETRENLKRLDGGEDLPYVRGDWFIANASQPPLYFSMLRLPEKVEDLEASLGINVIDNFLKAKVARAAFRDSGISEQHRLVERHRTRHGAYWKSYDFKANNGDRNLFVRPLGPTFEKNPHADQAFRHDGGEIIFSLPNGLQGYYLADAKGTRLDKAPPEIVNTPDPIEGDSRIVAGISCIACHKEGMKGVKGAGGSRAITLKDELRERFAVGGEIRKEVERRHPRPDDFAALLERDRRRFLTALHEATDPFLSGATDPEVISLVAKDYFQRLDLDDILIELGFTGRDLERHKDEVRAALKSLALADPASPVVARRDWQAQTGNFDLSPFQTTAQKLELGDPLTHSLPAR